MIFTCSVKSARISFNDSRQTFGKDYQISIKDRYMYKKRLGWLLLIGCY